MEARKFRAAEANLTVMYNYHFSLVGIFFIANCLLAQLVSADEVENVHAGILMPDVKLLGSDRKAGELKTTVIHKRQVKAVLPVVPPVSRESAPRLEPRVNAIINQLFSAMSSESQTHSKTKKRYNGYMKALTHTSVWLDSSRMQIPAFTESGGARDKLQLFLQSNGRLTLMDGKEEAHSFLPGQFLPKRLLPRQQQKSQKPQNPKD